jgi:hypothetical protein
MAEEQEPIPPAESPQPDVPPAQPAAWGIEPPPEAVAQPTAQEGAQTAAPQLQQAEAAQVPGEILAEIKQSREMKGRRTRRRTPLHRMEIVKGIPLGDFILGACGAMMALGVLGEWLAIVKDGRPTTYTGLDLALRLGHLETLLVLAAGLAVMIAPFARSGTVLPVIRARQAATLLLFLTIFLVVFELLFAYLILAAEYGAVEGLFPGFISDMGPGFWLSLLGSSLGFAGLIAFRTKPDAPQALGEVAAGAAPAGAGVK